LSSCGRSAAARPRTTNVHEVTVIAPFRISTTPNSLSEPTHLVALHHPFWPHVGAGSRLCENVRFQEVPGIIFCVMPPRPMLGAMLFFITAKSRWKFYFSKEHPSFRTAWVTSSRQLLRAPRRNCFNTGRQGTQPLCILLIDGIVAAINGKRHARSTSVTGRHGRRPWHLQRANERNRSRGRALRAR
jgi:hypothetical protein